MFNGALVLLDHWFPWTVGPVTPSLLWWSLFPVPPQSEIMTAISTNSCYTSSAQGLKAIITEKKRYQCILPSNCSD